MNTQKPVGVHFREAGHSHSDMVFLQSGPGSVVSRLQASPVPAYYRVHAFLRHARTVFKDKGDLTDCVINGNIFENVGDL